MNTSTNTTQAIIDFVRHVDESRETWEDARAEGRVGKNCIFEEPRYEWRRALELARLLEDATGEYRQYLLDSINESMSCGPNDAHVEWRVQA